MVAVRCFMEDLTWIGMDEYGLVGYGYGWLDWVVRVRSVTGVGVLISPSAPSVRHWDRLWSSAVKGLGVYGWCCHPALWILP